MNRVIRWGLRQGWRRGVAEGSRLWIVVGGVALAAHLGRKAMIKRERVVYKGRLEVGQVLEVRHRPPDRR